MLLSIIINDVSVQLKNGDTREEEGLQMSASF